MQLDSARLNPFRVLVFSRFHIESSAEKEKKCGNLSRVKLDVGVELRNT